MKDDAIYRQAAIDTLDVGAELLRRVLDDTDIVGVEREKYKWGLSLIETYISDMKELPSAQPDITDEQAIVHLQASGWMQSHDKQMHEMGLKERLADDSDSYDALLPSAQPTQNERVNSNNTLDTISRQAAIDAILAVTGNSSVRELYEHVQEHGLSDMWSVGVNAAIDTIIAVPAAQPLVIHCTDCEDWLERQSILGFTISELPPAQPTDAEIQKMQDLEQAEIQKAYELGKLDAMEEMPHWIPCSERLPEEETDVLVCNADGDINISRGSYSTEVKNEFIWYTSGWRFGKVIAWMPLPEPYREGGQNDK